MGQSQPAAPPAALRAENRAVNASGLRNKRGLLAYSVRQRTSEIGLRMALDASPADIFRLILRQGGWLAAIGLAGAFAAGQVIASPLVNTSGADLMTFAGAVVVIGLVGLICCYVLPLRATRVSPVSALRYE